MPEPPPTTPPTAEDLTVGQLLDRWLEDAVALSVRPRTLASYRYVVRVHLRPALGEVPLAALTAQDVQALLNARRRRASRPGPSGGPRRPTRSATSCSRPPWAPRSTGSA